VEFGNLHALEVLDMRNCVKLEKVPNSFTMLASLRNLRLEGCKNLRGLLVEFWQYLWI